MVGLIPPLAQWAQRGAGSGQGDGKNKGREGPVLAGFRLHRFFRRRKTPTAEFSIVQIFFSMFFFYIMNVFSFDKIS
jgi:hypothetical protein